MTAFLKLYAVSIVAFLALDALWLGLVARNFYREQMGGVVDLAWGATISAAVAMIGCWAAGWLGVA